MILDKNVDLIIKNIKKMNGNNDDIVYREFKINRKKVACIFLESVCSDSKITDQVLKSISIDVRFPINIFKSIYKNIHNTLPSAKLSKFNNYDDMFFLMSSGFVCVIVDGIAEGMSIEVKGDLNRSISEPTTEKIIRGPKDCFTENISNNIGLIRKRIKDPNLWFKKHLIGRRTKTKVSVAYIKDIARDDLVRKIEKKLDKIDIDGILDSGYIRDFLVRDSKSIFPTVQSTERPDLVCEALLDGKIAIIVENTPFVLIIPGLLIDFFSTSEDSFQLSLNASFSRILRILAFILTITIPGLYVAITTFNHEVLPDDLLVSIAMQRNGVPFQTTVELIILTLFFELLRESDIRTPDVMGNSISIVGALILGDAAVNAGIVSPIVVMIVATSSVASMLFSDIDIINACRWWRLFFLIGSSILGLIGFLIVGLLFLIQMCELESFGIPYLIPFSPLYKNDLKNYLVIKPHEDIYFRPKFLTFKNRRRLGDKNED